MASEPQTGVSDDDLVRRGDVRREFADYCPSAGDDFSSTLDRVPSASPPAERLARAEAAIRVAEAIDDPWQYSGHDVWVCVICRARGVWRGGDKLIGDETRLRHADDCALAAFRAAPEPEPEEPAKPEPCAGCHGRGVNCANPRCNYMVQCGSICNKCGTITPKCAAPKPEPCRTCKGHLTVSDSITHTDYDHDTGESREWGEMVSRPCPACRPGGGA